MFPQAPHPTVSVLICTYNEEKNLPYVLPNIPSWVDEVLLVDGHSTDKTVETAVRMLPHIRVIYQPGRGKGDALRFGIRQATGDIVVTLDADGSADPFEIRSFTQPLVQGFEFVKGSRFLRGGGTTDMLLHRRLANKFLVSVFNVIYRTRYTDLCYGYNAFWRKKVLKIKLSTDGYQDEPELHVGVKKAGLRVTEVPSFEKMRLSGLSKSPAFRQGFKALNSVLRGVFN
jgi:glycosyltransferase involved in cell wall biosynthesis